MSDYSQLLASMLNNPPDRAAAQQAALQAQAMSSNMNRRQWGGLMGALEGKIRNRQSKQDEYQSVLADALTRQAGIQDYDDDLEAIEQLWMHGEKAKIDTAHQKPSEIESWLAASPEERAQRDQYYANRRAPGVTVNTGDTPESAQQAANIAAIKTRTQNAVASNEKLMEAGDEARRQIPNYNLGLKLLESVKTGPFAEKINTGKKLAGILGVDVDWGEIADFEQLSPIFGEFLFQGIQNTKGSVSNKEMEIFQKINANYEYTTEGNRRLLEYAKARAERDVAIRGLVRDMRGKGASPSEIQAKADQYVDENDLSSGLIDLVSGPEGSNAYERWKQENGL